MKKRLTCYVVGVLILGLALLAVSCAGTTPAEGPNVEEPKVEEPKTEETKAEETKVEEAAAPTGGPTAMPHTLEGRDDCLMCHGEGAAKPFPADHAGRTSDTCTTCHKSAE